MKPCGDEPDFQPITTPGLPSILDLVYRTDAAPKKRRGPEATTPPNLDESTVHRPALERPCITRNALALAEYQNAHGGAIPRHH